MASTLMETGRCSLRLKKETNGEKKKQLEDNLRSVAAPYWLSQCSEGTTGLSGARQIAVGLVAMCEDERSEVSRVPVPAEGGPRQNNRFVSFFYPSLLRLLPEEQTARCGLFSPPESLVLALATRTLA